MTRKMTPRATARVAAAVAVIATLAALALILMVAACGSTPAPAPHAVSAVAACQAGLQHLYAHLGGPLIGPGRFQAAVNAMTFQGSTPHPCDQLSHEQVMRLAKIASTER